MHRALLRGVLRRAALRLLLHHIVAELADALAPRAVLLLQLPRPSRPPLVLRLPRLAVGLALRATARRLRLLETQQILLGRRHARVDRAHVVAALDLDLQVGLPRLLVLRLPHQPVGPRLGRRRVGARLLERVEPVVVTVETIAVHHHPPLLLEDRGPALLDEPPPLGLLLHDRACVLHVRPHDRRPGLALALDLAAHALHDLLLASDLLLLVLLDHALALILELAHLCGLPAVVLRHLEPNVLALWHEVRRPLEHLLELRDLLLLPRLGLLRVAPTPSEPAHGGR